MTCVQLLSVFVLYEFLYPVSFYMHYAVCTIFFKGYLCWYYCIIILKNFDSTVQNVIKSVHILEVI